MPGDVLRVGFSGIPKREEILLRSFLNLADSDFDFVVEIGDESENIDVLVLDESQLNDELSDVNVGLQYIVLGTNGPYPGMSYVPRPLHWSTFRSVFEETIDFPRAVGSSDTEEEPDLQLQPIEPEVEAVSDSGQTEQEIAADSDTQTESVRDEDANEGANEDDKGKVSGDAFIADEGPDHGDIPIDLSSLEVVGGDPGQSVSPPGVVKGGDGAGTGDSLHASSGARIDESSSNRQMDSGIALRLSPEEEDAPRFSLSDKDFERETVVMETDAIDAWTISIEAELETVSQSLNYMTRGHLAREPEPRKSPVTDLGVRLPAGIRFWEGDAEILLGGSPLFLIDETGQRLYSDSPIREWIKVLRERNLTRRDLTAGWYVDPSVKSSPLPWFVWCSAQARSKGRLLPGIDPGQEYLLEKWPNFELIRNDNQSLKLCALLFSRPESVKSLVAKSDIRGRKVVAFMNACHLLGLIKMTGVDEEVVWNQAEEPRSLTLMQRLRRSWGL